jgi:hypothetical protein
MFTLRSVWRPDAPVAQVWSLLADPRFTWPDWWPGLTASATGPVVGPDGLAAPGTWARLRVRSPLGYSLEFRLELRQTTAPSDGAPGHALLDVSGDLEGSAKVSVHAAAGGAERGVSTGSTDEGRTDEGPAEVRLLWEVSPVPTWFRAAARIGPGPLAWAHAHVMRAGERGLTERLRE